jgi:mannose-1-phosphate guanylyltransferase
MNIILLSGGSGLRLWPLSNGVQSKQFLMLLQNEHGERESMVQRVYGQLRQIYPDANVAVSTRYDKVPELRRQLGNVEVIPEPSRRDTYPAIMLAAAYLRYKKQLSGDDAFVVCPIDVFAELGYFQALADVEQLTQKYNIGLLGIEPTYPSEKYGYILREDKKVTSFREKPTSEDAAKLIALNALWNAGVFGMKIEYALENASRYLEFFDFDELYDGFDKLPLISFDYEIVEKEKSVGVTTYSGVWKDLGTWNTLTEELPSEIIGQNVQVSENCENTHILNMLNTPIVALGLKDTVIVASHDGILVSDKTESSFIKSFADKIGLRPMYEQRTWGQYRVLDYAQFPGNASLVKRLRIEAGKSISYQYHSKRSEIWVIVSGKGIVTMDGVDSVVASGSIVTIPVGAKHQLLAATELEFVEVQLGSEALDEEDIIRVVV